MAHKYKILMRDDSGSTQTVECATEPTAEEIADACAELVSAGDWGDDGAAVRVHWSILDADGDEIDVGFECVDIPPDHAALIRAVAGDSSCGEDPEDHEWTSEGEGGMAENPGVFSRGGTAIVIYSHCRRCGLRRIEYHTGAQRNPGEHDTVEYRLPDDASA